MGTTSEGTQGGGPLFLLLAVGSRLCQHRGLTQDRNVCGETENREFPRPLVLLYVFPSAAPDEATETGKAPEVESFPERPQPTFPGTRLASHKGGWGHEKHMPQGSSTDQRGGRTEGLPHPKAVMPPPPGTVKSENSKQGPPGAVGQRFPGHSVANSRPGAC